MLEVSLTRQASLCVALSVLAGCATYLVAQQRGPSRRAKPSPVFSTQPFDPSVPSLPPNFAGHNASELYKRIVGRNQVSAKGEFETTESYDRRLQAEAAKPLLGSLTQNSVFAFAIGQSEGKPGKLESGYDADRHVLHVYAKLKVAFDNSEERSRRPQPLKLPKEVGRSLSWADTVTEHSFYTGTNAFGAKVRVERHVQVFMEIAFGNYLNFAALTGFSDLKLDVAEAIRAKRNLKLLLVCRLAPPYVMKDTGYFAPKIDNPYEESQYYYSLNTELLEIWFFDSVTGRVYAKEKPTQPIPTANENSQSSSPYTCPTSQVRILSKPEPQYTEEARRAKVSGTVVLSVLLGANGEVTDIKVKTGLPHGLTERAIEAAKKILFVPAEVSCQKVSRLTELEYHFDLY
ncbi:MAG: energy transducer TonB [Pyrinomonadaceae bacterium]